MGTKAVPAKGRKGRFDTFPLNKALNILKYAHIHIHIHLHIHIHTYRHTDIHTCIYSSRAFCESAGHFQEMFALLDKMSRTTKGVKNNMSTRNCLPLRHSKHRETAQFDIPEWPFLIDFAVSESVPASSDQRNVIFADSVSSCLPRTWHAQGSSMGETDFPFR